MPGGTRMALLIDGENVSPKALGFVVERLGEAWDDFEVRRVYGDWRKSVFSSGWHPICLRRGLREIQQLSAVAGKNATDFAIVIDAMEFAAEGFGEIVVVSSDSDFMPLAQRLRERGVRYVGFGKKQTPIGYKKSCAVFLEFPEEARKPETIRSVEAPVAPQVFQAPETSVSPETQETPEIPAMAADKAVEPVAVGVKPLTVKDDVLLLKAINRQFHDEDGFTSGTHVARYAEMLGFRWEKRSKARKLGTIVRRRPKIFDCRIVDGLFYYRVRVESRPRSPVASLPALPPPALRPALPAPESVPLLFFIP